MYQFQRRILRRKIQYYKVSQERSNRAKLGFKSIYIYICKLFSLRKNDVAIIETFSSDRFVYVNFSLTACKERVSQISN